MIRLGRTSSPLSSPSRRDPVKRLALLLALAAFAAQPALAQEGPRIAHQPSSRLPFSAAIQVGNTYWLSGKLGANAETRAMTEGRAGAETHNIMRSFQELLEELDLTFDNVVRSTVYLTDLDDYQEMNEAYAQYFPGDGPSRVAVQVAGLVGGAKLEISMIAVRSNE
jgi:2-iminobutanoate/2-iminopropanoate deaminase